MLPSVMHTGPGYHRWAARPLRGAHPGAAARCRPDGSGQLPYRNVVLAVRSAGELAAPAAAADLLTGDYCIRVSHRPGASWAIDKITSSLLTPRLAPSVTF